MGVYGVGSWQATERYFRDYLSSSGKSPETVRSYVSNLKGFWAACAKWETTPYNADRQLIRAWVADRLEQVSAQRVHNDVAALRHFYGWLRETRDRDDDPTDGVNVHRPRRLPTRPLAHPELSLLLLSATSERDRLIILTLASTGLRISELASLTADCIDWNAGIIRVIGKGDKERLVQPAREVLNRLHAFLGMFPEGPLWKSQRGNPLSAHQIRKIIYDVAARAGVEGVHPHRFRAAFAVRFMDTGGQLDALQEVMGHSSPTTTTVYTHYSKVRRGLEHMSNMEFLAAG